MKIREKRLYWVCLLLICVASLIRVNAITTHAKANLDDEKWFAYITGENSDVTFKKNEAKEIKLEISANYEKNIEKIMIGNAEIPFAVKGTPKLYDVASKKETKVLGKGKYYLKFTLCPRKDAEQKTYHIPVSFLASDGGSNMEQYTMLDKIPVTYQDEKVVEKKASLQVKNIQCKSYLYIAKLEKETVKYTLVNTGDCAAKDITVTYDGFSSEGVVPMDKKTTVKLKSLGKNQSKKFSIPIRVAEKARTSAQKINITVSYKAYSGSQEVVTETESFYVQLYGEQDYEENNKLLVYDYKQSVKSPKAGGTVKLIFKIKNIGTLDAVNLLIIPQNTSNKNFTPVNHNPNFFIDSLKVGESKTVELNYSISKEIESGTSKIQYGVYYRNAHVEEKKDGFTLYVRKIQGVKEKPKPKAKGVPKLIINDYTTGENLVTEGSEFTLGFDVKNTHASLGADNIKVTVTTDAEGIFTIANGSNTFFISHIGPGKTVHKELSLKVKEGTVTKSYPVKINFEYEFYKPVEKTISSALAEEILGIPVREDSRPELTNIVAGGYGDLVEGEINSVTFDFMNKGKSPLYNIEVKVEGDFAPVQESYFLGTVEAGLGGNYEMEITPLNEGTGEGVIIVTYEDSNGVKGKIMEKFTGEITSGEKEKQDDSSDTDNVNSVEKKAKKVLVSKKVLAVVLILLLGALGVSGRFIIIRRRRKKEKLKREQEL